MIAVKTRCTTLIVLASTVFLSAGNILASDQHERCDKGRLKAWSKFLGCVAAVEERQMSSSNSSDTFSAAFARCRHSYFKTWAAFQQKRKLAGSICVGPRFTDNGDGTVSDNFSRLVWAKKSGLDSKPASDPHDADNAYTWSTHLSFLENGTVFSDFIANVNIGGLGGAKGWRVPNLAELQTIMLDFECSGAEIGRNCACSSDPCIDAIFGPTQSNHYVTSTEHVRFATSDVYAVDFSIAAVVFGSKAFDGYYARAVRGGW